MYIPSGVLKCGCESPELAMEVLFAGKIIEVDGEVWIATFDYRRVKGISQSWMEI